MFTVALIPFSYGSVIFAAFVFLVFMGKTMNLSSIPERPKLYYAEKVKNKIRDLIELVPMLNESYIPPLIWGRSGHLQTFFYGVIARTDDLNITGKRHLIHLDDGATASFDVFDATDPPDGGNDVTLAMCPGICNSSENTYIRSCVFLACHSGFRCAALNHLGTLTNVQVTSSRLFSYGGTAEYAAMISRLLQLYPETKLILIGFSMGGNIVTKYIGECPFASRFTLGISVCQGYDAMQGATLLLQWNGLRRLYLYKITDNVKKLLRCHYDKVVLPHVASGLVDEKKLWSSTNLLSLDDTYTRKVNGFDTVEKFYEFCSCNKLINDISIPMVFINSADDPLVPNSLWEIARKSAVEKSDMLLITPKHGGHLGFMEGSFIRPNSTTWLDRLILELCSAALKVYQ